MAANEDFGALPGGEGKVNATKRYRVYERWQGNEVLERSDELVDQARIFATGSTVQVLNCVQCRSSSFGATLLLARTGEHRLGPHSCY